MFDDEELELIEELFSSNVIEEWVQTKVEMDRVDSILSKIDRHLNG